MVLLNVFDTLPYILSAKTNCDHNVCVIIKDKSVLVQSLF